jgi:hypothetical protein
MFCVRCAGAGKYLGNGMVMIECKDCDGFGKVEAKKVDEKKSIDKVDRKSSAYKEAIKEIMTLNPDISREEAVKMFDNAYEKV